MTLATAFAAPVQPPALMPSVYGPPLPPHRAAEIPGMVSLPVHDLFPDTRPAIHRDRGDLSAVQHAAHQVLAGIDMSMIRPKDRVNVLCSEHGFGMLDGQAYAEMIKVIRHTIVERTGCENVRLVLVAWLGRKEPGELIEHFGFEEAFGGKVRGLTPRDQAVPIETEMGTLYGIRGVYDADWIVHCHYDDPREVYAHRGIDRITKPFGMSYARMETRSIFHVMMGPRSGNFIGRAIADSEFVQNKLAFASVVQSSPDGIIGIDADNDLHTLGRRVTASMLRSYGKMLTLFTEVEDCIPILDGGKWGFYVHAGGMCFGQLMFNGRDWFDLDIPDGSADTEKVVGSGISMSIRGIVLNHTLTGLPMLNLSSIFPTVVARPEMAEALRRDYANPDFIDYCEEAGDLFEAVEMAKDRAETDRLICYDGCYGAINLSESMAEHLLAKAPEVSKRVDEVVLPKWLKQRGIDPAGAPL
jgi:hypothetical protein